MKTSKNGLIELVCSEGVCLKPYLDSVGVVTIGIGATRTEIPGITLKHPPITLKEAFDLLAKSIVKYENGVNKALKVDVTQAEFDALVNITYNIGVGGMSKSTFIKRINDLYPPSEVAKAILMWNKPPEIMGRRKREAKLYTTGVYQNNGHALLFDVKSNGKPDYKNAKIIDVNELLKKVE